jgi:hypothetical protein
MFFIYFLENQLGSSIKNVQTNFSYLARTGSRAGIIFPPPKSSSSSAHALAMRPTRAREAIG